MPKFENEDDTGFIAVSGELRRWIRHMNNISTGNDAMELSVAVSPRELPLELSPTELSGRNVVNGTIMGGSVGIIENVHGGSIGGIRYH